ncbi:hypothetical protein SAMN05216326_12155 [Nitrosomonas marina]|uniref:DUF5666 domain-containing protein n=1 Tax=Nitrosomonas marina TaxID=917 RepID=A0A1I0DPB0_9PROT|nr:DUF5666 domain-containing protein [Nitrosomonas marina]SET34370.1 hypothetical protein SAMN05216326_12155 [Nitrosomonas marina]
MKMTLHDHHLPLNTGSLFRLLIVLAFVLSFAYPLNSYSSDVCKTDSSPANPLAATNSGLGGTGIELTQSGIGGTGIDGSGIGGTGIEISDYDDTDEKMISEGGVIGGTGIIGVITGFASICVNDIEIHYNKNTPVTMDGLTSSVSKLATGQMVVVRAEGSNDKTKAQLIAIYHAVVGPVGHIDPTTREIRVLNQTIQLQAHHKLEKLNEKWVRVSGLRLASGKIIATHIQPIQPMKRSIINGRITQINPGEIIIEGTRVQFNPESWPHGLSKGMEISVDGTWDGTSIHAQTVHVEPTRQILGDVQQIVMEGYVQAFTDHSLEMNNQSLQLSPSAQITGTDEKKLELNRRVQINGQLTPEHNIIVDKLELKPSPIIQDINNISISNGIREHGSALKFENHMHNRIEAFE